MIMEHNNENIYLDCKLWIFSFLNKSQHESLFLEPVISLTFLQPKILIKNKLIIAENYVQSYASLKLYYYKHWS